MIEIKIESAFEFLQIAHRLKTERNHVSQIEFYRGHSNKTWNIIPTICRNNILSFEEELVDEFLRRRPTEFSDGDGLFNSIAKMQHYGLHTRLIDITENPAVALYFACCDNMDSDGEVFAIQKSLDEVVNNIVSNLILEFYIRFKDSGGNYNLNDYYEYIEGKYNKRDINDAFYYIVNGYSCICKPKIIGERILRQAGSFMMFTNETVVKRQYREEQNLEQKIENIKRNEGINAKNIEDLKYLSITKSVQDVTKAHVKNEQDGYRYIIKAEYKNEILSELKTIGITKAFLFPELSNEGTDVMEIYLSRTRSDKMYYVYENWQADDKAVIHESICYWCNKGKGNGRNTEGEAHGRWHGPFATKEEAFEHGKSLNRKTLKNCGHCLK